MSAFFRRLWSFARPFRGRLAMGLICGTLYALMNGALVVMIKVVVDLVFSGGNHGLLAQQSDKAPGLLRPLISWVGGLLPEFHAPTTKTGMVLLILIIPLVMLLRGLFGYLNVYLVNWVAVRAIANLRTQLFDHLQNLSLSFFSRARTGDLISRVTSDTQVLYGVVGNSLASIIKDPLTILALLCVLLTQEPALTLLSIVVLQVCTVPVIIFGRNIHTSGCDMQGHISELTSLMHESFTGNRIIKAYNLEETVLRQFKETTKKYIGHTMRVVRANEIPSQLSEFLGAVGVALVLIYAGLQGGAKPGGFVAFILSIVLMYQPIKSLTRLHNQLQQAASAGQRVFEFLDTVSTVVDPPHPIPLQARQAAIEFRYIEFDYGERIVLRDINLTVRPGELVALVGSSGSGKTTLTNLLLRFYDPQRGSLCIGGADIRQVAIKDLRRQIGLVAQETILFNDTIRNNIALGRTGATDAEIEAAARHASAHDFIMEKPQGYDSVVGEKGVALSGGQRQRIAIARAILKNAPILVLDEATNALDAESERAVQKALEQLMQERTTICIAHRLSTIQKADLIVVLDAGRIVETGTHAELIQTRGLYYRLHELQFEPAMA